MSIMTDKGVAAALTHPLVIGLGGKLRSGKDTVADYLVHEYGFVKLGMSDALSEALLTLDPIVEVGEGHMTRYKGLIERVGYVEAKKSPEVRRLLQRLGTEVGRKMLGEDTWVKPALDKITHWWGEGKPVVLTGIRYPNEIEMIHDLGGVSVYVDRPLLAEQTTTQPTERVTAALDAAIHSSETSVKPEEFSYTIHNEGTLVDLWQDVDLMMVYLKDLRRRAKTAAHPSEFWPPYDH